MVHNYLDFPQISLDSSAKPTQPSALIWSDLPVVIEHVHPYILGILPKWVVVDGSEYSQPQSYVSYLEKR